MTTYYSSRMKNAINIIPVVVSGGKKKKKNRRMNRVDWMILLRHGVSVVTHSRSVYVLKSLYIHRKWHLCIEFNVLLYIDRSGDNTEKKRIKRRNRYESCTMNSSLFFHLNNLYASLIIHRATIGKPIYRMKVCAVIDCI